MPGSVAEDLSVVFSKRPLLELILKPSGKELNAYRTLVEFYMRDHYWTVISTLCTIYVFLQAFAIPGPVVIALLMAALFGPSVGGVMSMTCSLLGSSICYLLFTSVGRPILMRFFSGGLNELRLKLDSNKDNIFFFFLFLRVTPILPNWFINISSGNLGISFGVFFFGTLIGLLPNAIVLARAGAELAALGDTTSMSGFDWRRMVGLLAIGLLALFPVFLKKAFKSKLT